MLRRSRDAIVTRAIRRSRRLVLTAALAAATAVAMSASLQRNVSSLRPERLPDGVRLETGGGFLTLRVKSDGIVRVTFSSGREFRGDQMAVLGPESPALNPFQSTPAAPPSVATTPTWTLDATDTGVTLATAKLRVMVAGDGTVTFADSGGRPILAEAPGGRRIESTTVQGEATHHVQQLWQTRPDESLYGLGQRQEGKLDIKGYDFDLWQRNTVVYVPMIVSSRGYGLLWDNTSPSKFGDVRPFEAIPAAATRRHVREAGRTERRHVRVEHRGRDGDEDGAGSFVQHERRRGGTGCAWMAGTDRRARHRRLSVPDVLQRPHERSRSTGKIEIDHYKQNWATEYDQFKVHLVAGRRYPIKITNSLGTTLRVMWKTPSPRPETSMWSESGDGIDYYFLYGPEIDDVIGGYRTLTGRASMLPDWAFGLWQSKNKYNTQAEILRTLEEFRRRQIPVDTIVQDWQYWPAGPVGRPRVRSVPLSRSGRDDRGDPRTARALHGLGLGQVLSRHGELQGAEGDRRAVPDDHHGPYAGLAQSRLRVLRRLQRAGAEDVLGSGQSRALSEGRRRLVDGRDGTGRRAAVAADARSAAAERRSHGDGHGVQGDERVSAHEQRSRVRRPA